MEKLKCMIHYFRKRIEGKGGDSIVTFTRRSLTEKQLPHWQRFWTPTHIVLTWPDLTLINLTDFSGMKENANSMTNPQMPMMKTVSCPNLFEFIYMSDVDVDLI